MLLLQIENQFFSGAPDDVPRATSVVTFFEQSCGTVLALPDGTVGYMYNCTAAGDQQPFSLFATANLLLSMMMPPNGTDRDYLRRLFQPSVGV